MAIRVLRVKVLIAYRRDDVQCRFNLKRTQTTPVKASQTPKKSDIRYVSQAAPEAERAVQLLPTVKWIRLGLPFQLAHVNVYAVSDWDGWTVIDTGLSTPASVEAWDALLAGPLQGRPVTRVICTHMHPDHIGLVGWLCRRTGAPLLMSRTEYLTGRTLAAESAGDAPPEGEVFYRAAGWSDDQITAWREGYGMFGKGVSPLPRAFTRLQDGDVLNIGGDEWRVVVGAGHSPEHVCLWRTSDDVFIAGDQILPRISSNVSVWPTEPNADPLGDWMDSLAKLRGMLPEHALILPSHGEPFRGVHNRLDALRRGHETALKRLERTLRKPTRVLDAFPAVFGRTVGDAMLGMATGEAQAHLNYLERRGRARRARDKNGVDWWSTVERDEEA